MVSNGDQRERWRGETCSLQIETKIFSKIHASGKWTIKESFNHDNREISLSESSKRWICSRLSWKSLHPGLNLAKLRRVEGGVKIFIHEKLNLWGQFVAVQVDDCNWPSQYIIIPGGRKGEAWQSLGCSRRRRRTVKGSVNQLPLVQALERKPAGIPLVLGVSWRW